MELQNWHLIEMMARYHQLEIDSGKPQESRVTVALKLDDIGQFANAVEAVTGTPVNDQDQGALVDYHTMRGVATNSREFYEGFPTVDK